MQLLVDFLPVIVFYVVYKVYGILPATAAIMGVMSAQILIQWILKRTVSKMLLTSGVLVLVFGGITLVLKDGLFIQWKPTIVNWLFAVAFLGSNFIGEKPLIQRVFGHAIELPKQAWQRLNLFWVGNFAFLGAANLYVVYNFSQEFWVNFKLWGMIGLTLLMALIQGIWIARQLPEETKPEETTGSGT